MQEGLHTVLELCANNDAAFCVRDASVEFLSIVTHPRIFTVPSTTSQATAQVDAWLESPSVVLLGEDGSYWSTLRELVRAAKIVGPRIHDARIAALCLRHGIQELWSADRDFGRFPALRVRNPLV